MAAALFQFNAWSLAVPAAVISGYWLAVRRARQAGLETGPFETACTWGLGIGFVVSHAVEVLFYDRAKLDREGIVTLFKFWEGLSSYGGFVGGTAGVLLFYRQPGKRLVAADCIVQGIVLGWIFGRLGCTIVMDHPGPKTDLWFGFPTSDGRRHNLGLYEMLFTLLVLLPANLWLHRRKPPTGSFVAATCMLYGAGRFALDFLRATDTENPDPRYGPFTLAHYLSIAIFLVGLAALLKARAPKVAAAAVAFLAVTSPLEAQEDGRAVPRDAEWRVLKPPAPDTILAVRGTKEGTILLLTRPGGLFRSAGDGWERLSDDLPEKAEFRAGFILDAGHVWGVRGDWNDHDVEARAVYGLGSAGRQWQELAKEQNHRSRPYQIRFADAKSGCLLGWNVSLETRDGGRTWTDLKWPIQEGSFVGGTIWGHGRQPRASAPDPSERKCWVFVSPDGRSWKPSPKDVNSVVPDLWDVKGLAFTDPRRGVVFGTRGEPGKGYRALLLRTTDGGESWSDVPVTPVKVRGENAWVTAARFESAALGWAVLDEVTWPKGGGPGTPTYTLLETRTGGETWREIRSGGEAILLLEPLGDGTVLAAGTGGLILRRGR
jgi:phosphatidylglycerol:prolipoprotein diacylglycerol transferase